MRFPPRYPVCQNGSIPTSVTFRLVKNGSIACVRLGTRVYVSAEEIARIQREGLPSLKNQANCK